MILIVLWILTCVLFVVWSSGALPDVVATIKRLLDWLKRK